MLSNDQKMDPELGMITAAITVVSKQWHKDWNENSCDQQGHCASRRQGEAS